MKRRTLAVTGLVALLALGVALWLNWRRQSPSSEVRTDGAKAAAITQAAQQSAAIAPAQLTPSLLQQKELPPKEHLSPREQRRETINAWEQAREKEVEFWGKVIDQHNDPVAGVSVTATVTTHQIPPADYKPQPTTIYSTTSDVAGLFYIKGRVGRGLTIETMKKPGYVLKPELQAREDNLFWYNYDQLNPNGFKPNRASPVVFRMWKLGAPLSLVSQQADTRIPYDGTATNFDLLTGRKTTNGGDVRVTLARNPLSVRWGQRNYEWTATIEAVDGGVIESHDEFMYVAPEGGYQAKIVIHVRADDPQWTDEKAVDFYLKSRGGRNYGRVEMDFMAGSDKPTTGFSFRSVINPSSSRELESDSAHGLVKF